jgi:type I restriction enzyme S subunit
MKTNQTQKNIPTGWQEIKLADIGDFKNGVNKSKEDFGHGFPFVNLMDIFGFSSIKHKKFSLVNVSDNELENYNLKKGDILFVRSSVKPEGVGLATLVEEDLNNTVYSGFIIRFRTKNKLLVDEFKKFVFQSPYFRNNLIASSSVSANTNINQDSLNKLTIKFPSTEEQHRIVSVLETWDKTIEKLSKKIEVKRQIKNGLMQDLLTGKKRVLGFTEKWNVSKLGDFLINAGPRNKKLTYSRVLSVTNKKGFILPQEQFARVVASEDLSNYKVVFRGDFAYNPSRINVGSISRLDKFDNGVLSPMYVVFKTNNKIDSDFFYHWLDTAEANGKIRSCASGSVRESVDFKSFCSIKIKVPDIKEQEQITKILNVSELEIQSLESKLQIIKDQKKYLLNNLITGTIRTPETLSTKLTK